MDRHYIPVTNTQQLQEAIARCREAQAKFATFTQEQVDKIFLAAASAANQARIMLKSSRTTMPPSISTTPIKRPRPAA